MEKINKLLDESDLLQIFNLNRDNLVRRYENIVEKYNKLVDDYNVLKKRNEELEMKYDKIKEIVIKK